MRDGGDRSVGDEGPSRARGPDAHGDQTQDTSTWTLFARDLLTSVAAVLVVGSFLFAVSGVWPPLVAIESGSMNPHMEKNDLVFVMEEDRFPGQGAVDGTGVVPVSVGEEVSYSRFGGSGDVIVYRPGGRNDTVPIIHRAMFYVERGENWFERANQDFVGSADGCDELRFCPANRSGFITKGDANANYDQVGPHRLSPPVAAEWVVGTAEVRVPGVGWLRLRT